jgi:hypothetical protein
MIHSSSELTKIKVLEDYIFSDKTFLIKKREELNVSQ